MVTDTLGLARHLHDTIAQRLTGLSYFLGDAGGPAPEGALDRCRDEIHAAIAELREALDAVGRAQPIRASGSRRSSAVDDEDAALIGSFLTEALRNVRKHSAPTRVVLEAQRNGGATVVAVTNDGVKPHPGGGTRQGTRLLAMEAAAYGAVTDSHAQLPGQWCQRLIMSS